MRYAQTQPISVNVRKYFASVAMSCGITLDHGCGVGRHFFYLTELGIDTYGFDFSEKLIKHAREDAIQRYGPVYPADERLKVGNMFHLSELYPPHEFYTILSWAVLYECDFDGIVIALEGIERALKPGGYFFVMMRIGDPPHDSCIIRSEGGWSVTKEANGTIRTYFKSIAFSEQLKRFGFSIEKQYLRFAYGSKKQAFGQEFLFRKK